MVFWRQWLSVAITLGFRLSRYLMQFISFNLSKWPEMVSFRQMHRKCNQLLHTGSKMGTFYMQTLSKSAFRLSRENTKSPKTLDGCTNTSFINQMSLKNIPLLNSHNQFQASTNSHKKVIVKKRPKEKILFFCCLPKIYASLWFCSFFLLLLNLIDFKAVEKWLHSKCILKAKIGKQLSVR